MVLVHSLNGLIFHGNLFESYTTVIILNLMRKIILKIIIFKRARN